MGLVNRAVSHKKLMDEALALAGEIAIGQKYLQSFRNAVIWKVKVTRLCN